MRIVTCDELMAMPDGTIYAYYEPAVTQGLYRKGDTISWDGHNKDFYEASLLAECWNGDEPILDYTESRWGLYDYDMQFAVYDIQDLKIIRHALTAAIYL